MRKEKNKNGILEFILFMIALILIFIINNFIGSIVAIISLVISIIKCKNKNILTIISLVGSSLLIVYTIISFIISVVVVNNLFNRVKDNVNKQTESEIVFSMKEYLNRKYDPFVYQVNGFISSGWDHSYDLLNLSTTINGVEKTFEVRRYKTDTGYDFCESYFGLTVEEDFRNWVKSYSDKYFEDNLVYASLVNNCVTDDLNKNSTLNDFLNRDDLESTIIVIMVKETFDTVEEFNEKAKEFVDDWKIENPKFIPRVIYLSEENYNNLDDTNYTNYLVNDKIAEYN